MAFLLLRLKLFLQDLPITLGLRKSAATIVGHVPDVVAIETLRLRQHSSGCGVTGFIGYSGAFVRLNLDARFYDEAGSVVSESSLSLLASEGTTANFSITSPSFKVKRAEDYWRGFGDLRKNEPNTEQDGDAKASPAIS